MNTDFRHIEYCMNGELKVITISCFIIHNNKLELNGLSALFQVDIKNSLKIFAFKVKKIFFSLY